MGTFGCLRMAVLRVVPRHSVREWPSSVPVPSLTTLFVSRVFNSILVINYKLAWRFVTSFFCDLLCCVFSIFSFFPFPSTPQSISSEFSLRVTRILTIYGDNLQRLFITVLSPQLNTRSLGGDDATIHNTRRAKCCT
jgi:hypothetical protein